MNPNYLPTTPGGRLARVIEECGEVTQAIGKGLRFGMAMRFPHKRHVDPRGPTNAEALLDEMNDLRHALDAVEGDLVKIVIEAD